MDAHIEAEQLKETGQEEPPWIIKDAFDQLKEVFFPFEKNARSSELKKMEVHLRYIVPIVINRDHLPIKMHLLRE